MLLRLFLLLLPILAFASEKPIIILDPGHGGKDEGARVLNCVEKQLTLRTSYLTKKHLEALGYKVVMTRARDHYLALGTRVMRANKRTHSIFVSVHYNSAESPSAKGIEVYYYGKGLQSRRTFSRELASCVLEQVLAETKGASRGTKTGNFQVIRETVMPAILVEAGFITNREERALLGTHAYLDKLAKGIAFGVDKYVKSKT
ncbi:MAG: N-acetylmuramoyl-L-alanine amidase [Verrucomicrobia bacterium]|nr:N-acetylmuramoyl-L-alanine amidase [Verrucomicrobiota bacterium]